MPRPKGSRKTPGSGRKAGTPNKVCKAFKAAILEAFNDPRMGGTEGMIAWGVDNRTEFYKIAARLIPTEVVGPGDKGEHLIKEIVDVFVNDDPHPDPAA